MNEKKTARTCAQKALKISAKARYALRALLEVAVGGGRRQMQ